VYQTASTILIVAVTVGLSVYDLLPALSEEPGDTISAVLRRWSREWPVLAYLWTMLGAHFFLGHPAYVTGTARGDAAVLVLTSWGLLIANVAARDYVESFPLWVFAVLMLAGLPMGHFFWTQGA